MYLKVGEAAKFLSLSIATLRKHRVNGTGPKTKKVGGAVRYTEEDLTAWVEEQN